MKLPELIDADRSQQTKRSVAVVTASPNYSQCIKLPSFEREAGLITIYSSVIALARPLRVQTYHGDLKTFK